MAPTPKSSTKRVKTKAKTSTTPKPIANVETKKIFCSKGHPKCERCQARNIECVYSGPKKILVNEHNFLSLKAKLAYYEEIFNALPKETTEAISKSPDTKLDDTPLPEESDEDEGDEVGGTLADRFRQMSMYVVASRGSADNFFRSARTVSGLSGDEQIDGHAATVAFPARLPSRRVGSMSNSMGTSSSNSTSTTVTTSQIAEAVVLPPVDIARHYFAAQHMYIGTIFWFSDPELFDRQLREAYKKPLDLTDSQACLQYAKLLVILAFGRQYSVNQTIDAKDHPPGYKYFAYALTLLPDIHEEASVLTVETLAYVGYFLQNMNRREAAYLYVGVALRMAISLGLHQETEGEVAEGEMSSKEREHRRRVWWSIYSLDRIVTLKSGNPMSILDADIGVQMPSRLPDEPDNGAFVVLRHYTELSRILGEITTLIYRRTAHTGQSLVAAVHAILRSLSRWEASLPTELRLEIDEGKLPRESVSTFLHYYQCINMTVRPLLFHVIQKRLAQIRSAGRHGPTTDQGSAAAGQGYSTAESEKARDWQVGLSKKTVRIIQACITAARNTSLIMSKSAQHRLVATFGYMDREHALSAAIVLVMVCGTFPADEKNSECEKKALDLLKLMGDLGNTYVLARYEQLTHLRAMLARLTMAPASVPVPAPVPVPALTPVPSSSVAPSLPTPSVSVQTMPKTVDVFNFSPDAPSLLAPDFVIPVQEPPTASLPPPQPVVSMAEPVSLPMGVDFGNPPYFDFDFDVLGTSTLFDSEGNNNMVVEEDDSQMWSNAFVNNFDFSQFVMGHH